jgi:hypothetical protein
METSSASIDVHTKNNYQQNSSNNSSMSNNNNINNNNNGSNNVTAYEYDEIDQIYDYVRGLASLPKNLNNFESFSEASQKLPHSHSPQKNFNCNDIQRQVSSSSNSKVVNSPRYSSQLDSSHKQQHQQQLYSQSQQQQQQLQRETNLFNSDSWIKHELLEKPIPPSLKTIPSKKQLAQKRPTLIFTRTNNSHGPKLSTPQKADSNELSPQSPLFHIR